MYSGQKITGHNFKFLALAAILAFSSCNLERKLAKVYTSAPTSDTLLILKPSYLFKINLKEFLVPDSDSLDEAEKDSILMEKSLFLKHLSDSAVIDGFTQSFTNKLKLYGYKVLGEGKLDSLLTSHSGAYILNIAQITMEEYIHPYTSDYVVGDEIITLKDIDLNAVNFNVWIELSRLNSNEKNRVLFTSDYIFDGINGYFKQFFFTSEISFEYTIDTMTMKEVSSFGGILGERFAEYFYDYQLNSYILRNLTPDYPYQPVYYHYDPIRKTLQPARDDEKFIELEPR